MPKKTAKATDSLTGNASENLRNEETIEAQQLETISIDVPVLSGEGKIFTTSLHIAKAFEKQHKDVLKAISNLGCSEEFRRRNFAPLQYSLDYGQGEREFPFYNLTRDAFSILVMGFTGKKAMEWKEKFLEAFNAMETTLIAGSPTQKSRLQIPPRESEEKRRLRTVAMIKAFSAVWAYADDLCPSTTDMALCAHLEIQSLDDLQDDMFSAARAYILKAMSDVTNHRCDVPASDRELEIFERIALGCEQWRYFRDKKYMNIDAVKVPGSKYRQQKIVQRLIIQSINEFNWRLGFTQGANELI